MATLRHLGLASACGYGVRILNAIGQSDYAAEFALCLQTNPDPDCTGIFLNGLVAALIEALTSDPSLRWVVEAGNLRMTGQAVIMDNGSTGYEVALETIDEWRDPAAGVSVYSESRACIVTDGSTGDVEGSWHSDGELQYDVETWEPCA